MPANDEKYKLPHDIYIDTKRFISKYPKLQKKYQEASTSKSVSMDGMPKGTKIGNPTMNMALEMSEISTMMDVIYKPLFDIPVWYRDGIFNHIVHGDDFPEHAAISTWRRWQYRYVFLVYERRLEVYGEETKKNQFV